MAKNILIMTLGREMEIALNRFRRASFEKSGDMTIFAFPPVIILGETELQSFDRRSFHVEIEVERESSNIGGREVFLLTEPSRSTIERETGFSSPGLYYSSSTKGELETAFKIKHTKLALLKWTDNGYILLN